MRGRINIATIFTAGLAAIALIVFARANYSVAIEAGAAATSTVQHEEVQQVTPTVVNETVPDPTPVPPSVSAEPVVVAQPTPANDVAGNPNEPLRLVIPSISLNSSIIPLGVNAKGEMDVPSGATNNVGWYKYGTIPGAQGSAVLDAHVFAAFANLNKLTPGSDVYVVMGDGTNKHFRVYETQTYALADVPLQRLFNGSGGHYLNLITCAGQLTADRSTYDHRLVVYAEEII